jgi:hypothetical protein
VGYKEMGGKGGRENGGRKKERKKEHMRKNEEERANDLCITQGASLNGTLGALQGAREVGAPPGGTRGPTQGRQA